MSRSSLGSRLFRRNTLFAEGMKNDSAADGEDTDGGEGEDLGYFRTQVQQIGEEGTERAEDAERVEPEGRVDRMNLIAIAQAELQQDGGESDGGDDHDGHWAIKRTAGGEDDDQGEGSAQEARGDNGPTARWGDGTQGFRMNIT